MEEYSVKNYLLENYIMLIMLLGAFLFYFSSRRITRMRSERVMPVIGLGIFIASILQYLLDYYGTFSHPVRERLIVAALIYWIYPLMVMLVVMSIRPREKRIIVAIPFMIITVYCVLMQFETGLTVYYDENNHRERGALGYLPVVIILLYLVILIQSSWVYVKDHKAILRSLFIFITGSLFVSGVLATAGVVNEVNDVAAFCVMLYLLYIMITRQANVERELLLADTQLYQRQVSPHFIYNGLGMIRSMLPGDSDAKEVLDHFTRYLRGNAELMTETGLISVAKEREILTNYYYMIEKRFEGSIVFEHEPGNLDFKLPAFTVQILVENAVNHGIRKKESGSGTVRISSYRTKHDHVIEVKDDGVGFDVDSLKELWDDRGSWDFRKEQRLQESTGKNHLGLINLTTRLEILCNGKLTIMSTPGEGTLARVEIPISTAEH